LARRSPMLYLLSKTIWAVAEPSTLLLLVCIAGSLISLLQSRSRWGRTILIFGVVGLSACALLPIGAWLMRPLEDRFPQLREMPAHIDGIIVLGGAIDLKESVDRGMPALNLRAERMTAFVALARLYPHARLVFAGGNPDSFSSGPTEADVARAFFNELGLDPRRVVFERKSRNTRENALFSKWLANPKPNQRWILVTSAADMPRAVGCFRAVAWPIIAFPVDYHTQKPGMDVVPGLVSGLLVLDWAMHEWIGLVYYRWRGWTSSLFPGP
jgi:uncharacterized SAM-binding protein YcdF (DUF218 family)